MRFGSLFAGVGGFDLGLERAGWSCAWQVESDPRCRQVLRRHWPDVPIYDDVREVGDGLETVELVCGGFPCQDVSVAGRRAGLEGARSGLWWEFRRIIAALAPRWVLIENVPGLLSSNDGRDLGAIIGSLAGLGYVGSWRVLDAQHFDLAQRRQRLFVVGHLGGEPRPEVLSLAEGVCGHPAPSREAGERVAATLTRGVDSAGRGGTAGRRQRGRLNVVAIKGAAIGRKPEAGPQWGETLGDGTCYTLNCTEVHAVAAQCHGSNVGPMGTLRAGNGSMTSSGIPFVAHALRAEGADASEDGSGRGTPLVAQATGFALNQRREGRLQDVAGAVHEPSGTQVNGVLDPLTYVHPRILRNSLSSNQVGIKDDGLSDALTSEGPGAVMQAIPRRLTPVECSRLQGFPDDWNIWGVGEDGARVELSDSARYRQLGNAVSVPVAEWIGHRLRLAADAST